MLALQITFKVKSFLITTLLIKLYVRVNILLKFVQKTCMIAPFYSACRFEPQNQVVAKKKYKHKKSAVAIHVYQSSSNKLKVLLKKENVRQAGSLSVDSYIYYVEVVVFVRVSNKCLLEGIYKAMYTPGKLCVFLQDKGRFISYFK